jgi:hypothetical protein
LIRSKDGGRMWDKLGLEGEMDFHLLGASWNTNAIYVWNPAPNSRMRKSGLHSTVNDGFAWKPAQAAGLQGDPHALAVHPDDAATMAVATSTGSYLSRDSGNRFEPVAEQGEGLAVFFDLDGKHLWYGAFDGQPRLARVALATASRPLGEIGVLSALARSLAATRPGSNAGKAPLGVIAGDHGRSGQEGLHRARHEGAAVIYELHVRGFTQDPSSGVSQQAHGTYNGVIEKIPYLKELGVRLAQSRLRPARSVAAGR